MFRPAAELLPIWTGLLGVWHQKDAHLVGRKTINCVPVKDHCRQHGEKSLQITASLFYLLMGLDATKQHLMLFAINAVNAYPKDKQCPSDPVDMSRGLAIMADTVLALEPTLRT